MNEEELRESLLLRFNRCNELVEEKRKDWDFEKANYYIGKADGIKVALVLLDRIKLNRRKKCTEK